MFLGGTPEATRRQLTSLSSLVSLLNFLLSLHGLMSYFRNARWDDMLGWPERRRLHRPLQECCRRGSLRWLCRRFVILLSILRHQKEKLTSIIVTNVANTTTTSAVVSSSVAATVSSTDSAAATTTVATDSAAVSSTAVATSTAATDSAAVSSTAVATSTAATDSAVVSSTATSTDAAATTTGVAVDAVKAGSTGSTCGRRMVRRSSRRSPVSDDEELAKFDEEETNGDDVSLEEANRLLAEDLEKFRFRAKRLADRLERVKRSRIIGDRDLN